MKCPQCGEVNPQGFHFCRACGGGLRGQSPAEGGPAAPPRAKARMEQRPNFQMVATQGPLSGRQFKIDAKGLTIGRDPEECQLVIPDEQVSRLHAWIGWGEAGQLVIEDRESANGTYVNGKRVPKKTLVAGDVVAFGPDGKHLFRLMRVMRTPPRAPPPTSHTEMLNVAPPPPRGSPSEGTSAVDLGESMRLAFEESPEAATIVDRRRMATVSRPHVELIVDKYVVRSLNIPESGLCVGRLGQPGGGHLGNAEIHELDQPAVENHDIRRLDIPVDDLSLVGIFQAGADWLHHRNDVSNRKNSFFVHQLLERLAFQVLHGHVEDPARLVIAEIVYGDNVGMGQAARSLGFHLKASAELLQLRTRNAFRLHRLDGHRTANDRIEALIHDSHRPSTDQGHNLKPPHFGK